MPLIGHQGLPIFTRDFTLTLGSAPANAIGVLIVGLSGTSWNGVPLPLPLASLGFGACDLNVSLDVTLAQVTSASGTAAQTFQFPVSAPVALYWQWGVFDAVGALTMSGGLAANFHR